ncbi:MAG: inositol monophosphatase family protein [Gammaproteobacteria bacterium WSBS_2016_MAG_OTU1]
MNEIEVLMEFAEDLADAARRVTLPYFRGGVAIENKNDESPVTIADKECERIMRDMIVTNYPHHGILGEEFGVSSGSVEHADNTKTKNDECVWVLDPIDGTRSFISGSRQYCTLIALVMNGVPVLGVIDMPALDERWTGIDLPKKKYSVFNNERCRVSAQTELSAAVMATTTLGVADIMDGAPDESDVALRRLCRAAGHVRLGGDASAFGGVASGFLDMAADYEMAPYDYLPIVPIIRAAGGIITDWTGGALSLDSGKTTTVAAASPSLHSQALAALAVDV